MPDLYPGKRVQNFLNIRRKLKSGYRKGYREAAFIQQKIQSDTMKNGLVNGFAGALYKQE